ncbi:MAG: hypothetical protein ACT4O9_10375 [Blastocatellia bacterium]
MNTEELERSLRTEFESYLKGALAEMRQNVAEFQKHFEAEFEKHRSQMDEAFRSLSQRIESEPALDQAFSQSVVEHLRLAKDAGAEIAAMAFSEAEKLQKETEPPPANYDQIRDAINDISSKTSQSTILSALVDHAGNFAPRGAFFIVKNDHFVGWRVFGKDASVTDDAAQALRFPISDETLLARAVGSLSAANGSFNPNTNDSDYLDPLNFGHPDRMVAIPLTARGRGVAVMYADYGDGGTNLNAEALETLVKVAGLTVELLASAQVPAQHAVPQQEPAPAHEAPAAEPETPAYHAEEETTEVEQDFTHSPEFEGQPVYESPQTFEQPSTGYHEEPATPYTGEVQFETQSPEFTGKIETAEAEIPVEYETVVEEVEYYAPVQAEVEREPAVVERVTEYAFETNETYDAGASKMEAEPVVEPEYAYASEDAVGNGKHAEPAPVPATVPVVEMATSSAPAGRTRLSDRNVDLPIEVADDERRLHNDARRFARLLVSEIKLYNEQKVNEGRESNDLYDRLKEAIDRSREMYDKRVQPTVASKFDYFNYELVNNLAEGSVEKLGTNYRGSSV